MAALQLLQTGERSVKEQLRQTALAALEPALAA
jgi:hypothetical protein